MRKSIPELLIYTLFLFIICMPAVSEVTATIVDLDGTVMVSRRGEFLDEFEVDYGTELYSYDTLQTGRDGYAEISIDSPVSPEMTVRVMENTTIFMEHTMKKQNPDTSVTVHRGAVQARAAALIQGGQFNIKTDSSVMGVRGTVFSVITSPDTSLLVTCREGKVSCTTEGEEAQILPGRIYESDPSRRFTVTELHPDDIDAYITEWQQSRLNALMINGAMSLQHYANLYLQTAPGFLEAFSELSSKQDIFRKWEQILDEGRSLSMGEATKDKIALSNGIIRLRSRLPIMEHVYYTLYDLTNLMEESEKIREDLSETAARTLEIYQKRQEEFAEKLIQSRYYFRIFLEIDRQASGQSLMPSSDLMDDFLMDEPFFIAPPEPGIPTRSPF